MLRHIPLGKMNNLRDLGGYPGAGGRTTAWERFLRGDVPLGLGEADLQWLPDRDITTVIDLRTPAEVERKPDQLSAVEGFHYVNCPLLEGENMPNLAEDVARGYFDLLDRGTWSGPPWARRRPPPAGCFSTVRRERTAPACSRPCC